MKTFCVSLVALALISFVGCESHSTPGGPGASKPPTQAPGTGPATNPPVRNEPTNPASRPTAVNRSDDTFTLSAPTFSTKVKQGETKAVTIGIKRGKNFDEDVTVRFADLPKGVTIEPASGMIKHGDSDAKFSIHAANDAALGDFTVLLTGHPAKGLDATNELKLTIAKK